jgi:VanZ family protein
MEFYQLLCQDRVPSTTDVLNNVAGTVLGAWIALRVAWMINGPSGHSAAVR